MRLSLFALLLTSGCFPTRTETRVGGVTVRTFQHDYSNTHVLQAPNGSLVMIDSGLEANASKLESDLVEAGLDPKKLEAIILTHGHADHAGGARALREKFGARIVAGAGDRPLLAEGHNDTLCPTNDDARSRLKSDQDATFTSMAADLELDAETDLRSFSSLEGQVIPLPGHTPGSLVVRSGGSVFVGDLFRGSVFGHDAEVHFYMCDLDDNRADINTLLTRLAPDAEQFFPGHFGPLTRAAVEKEFKP